MLGIGGGGGGVVDYDDPLQYYRMTERFIGANNASGSAGVYDWNRSGATDQNMALVNTSAGAMMTKGIVAHTGTDNQTRWHFSNRDIGSIRPGVIITIRVRPQAEDFSENAAFTFGIQTGNGVMPRVAGTVDFLGFRYDTAVDTNWHLVVKDNAGGAGAESTLSLGALDTTNWTTLQLRFHDSGVTGLFNGVVQGVAPLTNLDLTPLWSSVMCAHNVVASDASQRICDITLLDIIIPTGGW